MIVNYMTKKGEPAISEPPKAAVLYSTKIVAKTHKIVIY